MNASPELIRFAGETHACAMQMMENAAYIQKELPGLEMPDSLRAQITKLCSDLIGSKHDLTSEVVELEEAMVADASLDRITMRVKLILGWIQDDVSSIHQCVEAVNEAVTCGTAPFIVAMLIMESAANILNTTPAWTASCIPSAEEDQEEEIEDEGEAQEPDENCYGFSGVGPYEDDGEGYGSSASRASGKIVTSYGGWMKMLRIALVYGWKPEGGSYYCMSGKRIVSSADASAIHHSLESYIQAPHEAYSRWLAYVAQPKEQQARIFPMGDECYDGETKRTYPIDPVTSYAAIHWKELSTGGCHTMFARRLSDFCAEGEFRI